MAAGWEPWAKIGLVAIGYYFGGPLGAMGGAYLGGVLWPTDYETEMPAVHDMPIQSSAIGIPITLVYGMTKIAGNLIWLGPSQSYIIKHKSDDDIFGNNETIGRETKYKRSFLISLCEGPASVIRAWKDKKEISLSDFTFYDGSNNSGLSTILGEDYAEYNNLCLAYFEDYELGNSQRIPNFIFEVNSSAGQFPLYVGTNESPAGDDLFETDYSGAKIHQSEEGHATNGIYDIVVQPSTNRIIVSGVQVRIYESDWTFVGTIGTASHLLIDPDDDDYIYCSGAGGIFKYKISTQALQWSNTDYTAYGACISEDSGRLYVCGIIGDGINEVNRDTGVHVRNLQNAVGHGSIVYFKAYLFATGSRQGNKSVWKYNEASGGAASHSYDTGGGTHKIIEHNSKIFVCGERSDSYTPTGGMTGYKTIFKFNENLAIHTAYDDGNSVYWLNDMRFDNYRNQIVVTSKGDSVDENGNTANIRWFNESLILQSYMLMYDTNPNALVTAFGISPSRIKVDYYLTAPDANQSVFADRRCAQTFLVTENHALVGVRLKMYRTGLPGTVTVRVWSVSGDLPLEPTSYYGMINGNLLEETPIGNKGPWEEILFSSVLNVSIGQRFAIVVESQGADVYNMLAVAFHITGTYSGGRSCVSTDAGVSWTGQSNYDLVFQTLKDIIPPIPSDPGVNFAFMIKDLLINKKCGNYEESDLITEDFESIIQYCDTYGLKGSLAITQQKPLPDWIAAICSHFQGYFYEIGGKIGLNCYRSQDSVLSILQDDLLTDGKEPPVHVSKRPYSSTYNRLEVAWTDRNRNYKTAVVPAFDRIDQRESGQTRTRVLNLKMITNKELAAKMAWRIFIDQIYRFSQYTFKLGYKSMLLEVGDVIDVTDGHLLTAKKMRVMSVNEEKDGRKSLISAIEDISDFYPEIEYAIQESESEEDPEITLDDGTVAFRENYTDSRLLLSISPGGAQCSGFYIYRSYDNESYALVGQAPIRNVPGDEANSTGTIQSSLPAYPAVVHRRAESFNVSIGTIADLDTLVTDDDLFNNRKLARVGTEIIGFKDCVESLTIAGIWRVSNLIRGLFGTEAIAHVPGESFSTLDVDFVYDLRDTDIGKTLYFKVVSFYAEEVQLLSEVSTQSHTVSGKYKKPLPVSLMRINGREGLKTYKTVDVTLDWYFCSKSSGFGRGGYGAALWGAYVKDLLLEQLKVELEEEDGTPIIDAAYDLTDYGEPVQLEILEADRNSKNPVRVKLTPGSHLWSDETRSILIEKV